MNPTQMTMADMQLQMQLQTFKENIDLFVELLIPEMERRGYEKRKQKKYLTTKEMCKEAGINYSTWYKSEVRNDPRITRFRERNAGRDIQYDSDGVETIREIWLASREKKGDKQ